MTTGFSSTSASHFTRSSTKREYKIATINSINTLWNISSFAVTYNICNGKLIQNRSLRSQKDRTIKELLLVSHIRSHRGISTDCVVNFAIAWLQRINNAFFLKSTHNSPLHKMSLKNVVPRIWTWNLKMKSELLSQPLVLWLGYLKSLYIHKNVKTYLIYTV